MIKLKTITFTINNDSNHNNNTIIIMLILIIITIITSIINSKHNINNNTRLISKTRIPKMTLIITITSIKMKKTIIVIQE